MATLIQMLKNVTKLNHFVNWPLLISAFTSTTFKFKFMFL